MFKMIGYKLHPVLSTLLTFNFGFYGFVASLKYTDTKSLRLKLSLNYSDCSRLSEMMYDFKQSKINFTVH